MNESLCFVVLLSGTMYCCCIELDTHAVVVILFLGNLGSGGSSFCMIGVFGNISIISFITC